MTTDAGDASSKNKEAGHSEEDSNSTVLSLTDLFDQLDRAAFKRVLDKREARGESLNREKSRKR